VVTGFWFKFLLYCYILNHVIHGVSPGGVSIIMTINWSVSNIFVSKWQSNPFKVILTHINSRLNF